MDIRGLDELECIGLVGHFNVKLLDKVVLMRKGRRVEEIVLLVYV